MPMILDQSKNEMAALGLANVNLELLAFQSVDDFGNHIEGCTVTQNLSTNFETEKCMAMEAREIEEEMRQIQEEKLQAEACRKLFTDTVKMQCDRCEQRDKQATDQRLHFAEQVKVLEERLEQEKVCRIHAEEQCVQAEEQYEQEKKRRINAEERYKKEMDQRIQIEELRNTRSKLHEESSCSNLGRHQIQKDVNELPDTLNQYSTTLASLRRHRPSSPATAMDGFDRTRGRDTGRSHLMLGSDECDAGPEVFGQWSLPGSPSSPKKCEQRSLPCSPSFPTKRELMSRSHSDGGSRYNTSTSIMSHGVLIALPHVGSLASASPALGSGGTSMSGSTAPRKEASTFRDVRPSRSVSSGGLRRRVVQQ